MKIYIIEDDLSVIGILEDIVERNGLGTICGDSGDGLDLNQILLMAPDLILVDLLMPEKDGIQVIRELRELGCTAKYIMISQVADKEMIAKAYSTGVEFFIQKPINLIEVRTVIGNIVQQMQNERALKTIQNVFSGQQAAPKEEESYARERRRLKHILGQLGMAGEKGFQDIVDMCIYLLDADSNLAQMSVSNLCAKLSTAPKTMEQRARRAVERGLSHIASLGLEDYNNEIFMRYSARLFSFQEVRAEMSHLQGQGSGGKANLKKFLDGLMLLLEEY